MMNLLGMRNALSLLLVSALSVGNVYAADATVTCTATDRIEANGMPGPQLFSLSSRGPMYLICVSTDIKAGQTVTVTFLSNQEGPNSSTSKTVTAEKDATYDAPFIADMSIPLPTGMTMPVGRQEAEVAIDKVVVDRMSVNITD